MDAFSAQTHLSESKLRLLNYCRLFLQVTYVSELCNASGTSLIPEFWRGDPSKRQSDPLLRYPHQTNPSPKIWSFWHTAIRFTFCTPHSTILLTPLSLWTTASHRRFHVVTHNPLRYWSSPSSYHNLHRVYQTKVVFSSSPHSGFLSAWSTPIDVLSTFNQYITTSIPSPHEQPIPDPISSSLEDCLQHLLDWQRPLLHDVEHHFPLVSIIHHLHCPFDTTSEII